MQIVDEEDDRAARHSRRDSWCCGCVGWIIESSNLQFTRTARCDPLKERHRPRLAVHHQVELIALQPFDEVAFFVEDRDRGLDQLGFGGDNVLTIYNHT